MFGQKKERPILTVLRQPNAVVLRVTDEFESEITGDRIIEGMNDPTDDEFREFLNEAIFRYLNRKS